MKHLGQTSLLILTSILIDLTSNCFLTHFVYYGQQLCCFNLQRIIMYQNPYIVHLNEEVSVKGGGMGGGGNRELKKVEKSDVKRMQVLKKYGGLYLDTDQLVNIQCIERELCRIKEIQRDWNRDVYVMDWSDREYDKWKSMVPVSFIYTAYPNAPILEEILQNYNMSESDPIKFSGPAYMQKFRNQLREIKIDRKCQFHVGLNSWQTQNNVEFYWSTVQWSRHKFQQDQSILPEMIRREEFFHMLYRTNSIIYPYKFKEKYIEKHKLTHKIVKQNPSQPKTPSSPTSKSTPSSPPNLQDKLQKQYNTFNHIQIINSTKLLYRVMKFSDNEESKKKIQQFMKKFPQNTENYLALDVINSINKQNKENKDGKESKEGKKDNRGGVNRQKSLLDVVRKQKIKMSNKKKYFKLKQMISNYNIPNNLTQNNNLNKTISNSHLPQNPQLSTPTPSKIPQKQNPSTPKTPNNTPPNQDTDIDLSIKIQKYINHTPFSLSISQKILLIIITLIVFMSLYSSCFALLISGKYITSDTILNFGIETIEYVRLFLKLHKNKAYKPIGQGQELFDQDVDELQTDIHKNNSKQTSKKQPQKPKYQSYGSIQFDQSQSEQHPIYTLIKQTLQTTLQKYSPILLIASILILYTFTSKLAQDRIAKTMSAKKIIQNNLELFSDEDEYLYFDLQEDSQFYGYFYHCEELEEYYTEVQGHQNPMRKPDDRFQVEIYMKDYNKFMQKYSIDIYPIEHELFIKLQNPTKTIYIPELGLDKFVQIGSAFDHLQLHRRQQFYDFRMGFADNLRYYIYQFGYDEKVERKKQEIQYLEFFNQKEAQWVLENIQKWGNHQKKDNNIPLYLASYLVYNHTSNTIKQLQYFYYNKLYNLDQIQHKHTMCIFSTGYQLYSKNKYKHFFQSVQRQNYTDYVVVVVDDASPDQSARKFYQFLQGMEGYRMRNRIKIVRNVQRLGALANMYLYIKRYCPKDSIVLNVDTDDALIGYQTFNVLNAVYQDPQVWYVYTKYFRQLTPQAPPVIGQYSLPLTVDVSEYRTHKDWNTSHMRTYRQQVMDRVPMEQYVQYVLDEQNNKLIPRFYQTCADRFQVYSHLQLCGNDRIRHLQHPLYFYDESGTTKPCHYEYEHYVQYMSRAKRRIKRLQTIDGDLEYLPDEKFSDQFLQEYKNRAGLYLKCMAIFQRGQYLG